MLPLQQAFEVKESILEFIRTTYHFKDADVHKAFYDFIENPEHGLIKGPYVSLKAPFVSAPEGFRIPLDIAPGFPPYKHQIEAFEKLTTEDGHKPQNTLITTGTGSGKTECFLYPILDYCYKHIGEKGIKVIILYPMNALATDQAKRLAQTIWGDERLKGKITAGLFIGKGLDKKEFSQVMREDGIIEDDDFIVSNPPDILLTNFKMLDYGIMKGSNASLWQFNEQNPELLKFLILDELHTYDGAQGTDVANLIRRLKLRIGMDSGMLCGIGTSATIGSGEDSKQLLCNYASDIYGETFLPENVIEEHRVPSDELFSGEAESYLPTKAYLDKLTMRDDEHHDAYIKRQMKLWQADVEEDEDASIALTETLKSYQITRDIFKICEENGIVNCTDLLALLAQRNESFAKLESRYQQEIIESLLALIAEAKIKSGKIKIPFLPLQVQLWVRELSGIRRIVCPEPRFTWKSDAKTGDSNEVALPMYYCRECGASGWIATKSEMLNKFDTDGSSASNAFMQRATTLWFLNTQTPSHKPDDNFIVITDRIKMDTLDIVPHLDPDETMMDIYACKRIENVTGRNHSTHHCPECFTNFDDLSIVGARTATLASLSVSQLLSSNLDCTDDKDRKTLTFTNGVQDAAHLSGFFMSREYRFTMRASIQKIIEILEKEGAEVTLRSIYDRFLDYWKTETGSQSAYLHRFFPGDYSGEIDLEKNFRTKDGGYTDKFLNEFDLRIFWEIIAEFGLNTSFGRSLEKTGSSATYFKDSDIKNVYTILKPWMDEYLSGLVDEETFEHFLIGFLERSLVHGAVSHPFLENFRTGLRYSGLYWYDGSHFLYHRFGRRERYPQPFVVFKTDRSIPADNAYTSLSTWYYRYFCTCFNPALADVNVSNDFYVHLAEALVKGGIFDRRDGSDGPNYMIRPEMVHVTTNVISYRCDQCQKVLVTSTEDTLSKGTHCIGNKCHGSFVNEEHSENNYYQRIYRREKTPRIYSHEHTGLLGRKQREDIELDFKTRPRQDSINSLVATSTLEMGIDIGDLNSEINVSIPPLPSNYLQRVGRAGRKTGAALILDFAKGDPHDLFFFEEPQEMMQGKVNTPGCYLNAKDILRRHFYAFCIDSWVKADPTGHVIPSTISQIHPEEDFLSSPDFFINRINLFIEEHFSSLTFSFGRHYPEDTFQNVIIPMYELFSDKTFEKQVELVFSRLRQEYMNLTMKMHEIWTDIQSRHLSKSDDEYKELMAQKSMLHRQRVAIKKRQVLEFMTDEGLLPNYAFPETGVKMTASILGNVPKGEDPNKQADIIDFELVRPASAGLKDLAPGNSFYFDGMKLVINGINTSNWNSEYGVVRKRYCSKCDCIIDYADDNPSCCPKCGDPMFGSESNVHTFVDLREVKVNQKLKDTVLDDSTDEREKTQYKSSFHFRFDAGTSAVSYGMKDIPFGIEFVKNVTIFETNLGEANASSSNSTTIKNIPTPVHGFVTCRYCGKTVPNPGLAQSSSQEDIADVFHYRYCKHRDKLYQGCVDDYFEHVFLSREFHTEAIKILLPVQEIDSEATMAMFKAGLNLGLKYYFQGNPQHIQMRDYCEFNRSSGKFDSYIVMYDSIPGGTGYLAKLFDTKEFTKVLKIALQKLDECSCQYTGKDGCYHCVLSYDNKFTRGQLSRAKAAELFRKIVEKSDNWETITGSIGTVTRGGSIEESELETRFITSIREVCQNRGWSFQTISGLEASYYKIEVSNKDGEVRTYTIVPQVNLGPSKGVEFNTRTDFIFECVKRVKNGAELPKTEIPMIAVYLDGYAYHGAYNEGKVRFFDDFRIREAIHRSGKIISWTITWDDITSFNEGTPDSLYIPTAERDLPFWNHQFNAWKQCKNNYERFLKVLCEIDGQRFAVANLLYMRAWAKGTAYEDWKGYLAFEHDAQASETPVNKFILGLAPRNATWAETRIALPADNTVQYNVQLSKVYVTLDKDTWHHFWLLYNLLNLAKYDMFVPEPSSVLDIDSILENFDDSLHDMVRILLDKGVDFDHDGGFSLTDEDGEIIADAGLGVESLKVVIDPYGGEEKFIEKGYTVLMPEDIDRLKEIIEQ